VHYGSDLVGTAYEEDGLLFRTADAAPSEMPAEALLLKTRVEAVFTQIKTVLGDHSAKCEQYARTIGDLARIGLEDGELNVATQGLTSLQERFAQTDGIRLRASYIRSMVRLAVRVGGSALVVAIVGGLIWSLWADDPFVKKIPQLGSEVSILISALYILVGISLGASLSAYTRNRTVTFENIGYFDQDKLDPRLRYVFLCFVAAALGVLLFKGWLVVGVTKDMLLNDFSKDPGSALILGLLTGYSEANVTRLITGGFDAVKDWRASGKP
jgi:hypothetical protein